jgi:hypothetical protein
MALMSMVRAMSRAGAWRLRSAAIVDVPQLRELLRAAGPPLLFGLRLWASVCLPPTSRSGSNSTPRPGPERPWRRLCRADLGDAGRRLGGHHRAVLRRVRISEPGHAGHKSLETGQEA